MDRSELFKDGRFSKVVETYGSEDFAYEIIYNVAEDAIKNLGLMKAEVEKDEFSDYAVYAHGIKGVMKTIFNDELTDRSLEHEKAAKEGNFDFVRADFEGYYAECRKFCDSILQ